MKTTRCTWCATEFTDEETVGVTACPACGSTGVPCRIEDDVTVTINWHELRVLGIWADNYAQALTGGGAKSQGLARIIAKRLEKQHPHLPPLTLFGEIEQLQETFPSAELLDSNGNVIIPAKKIQ